MAMTKLSILKLLKDVPLIQKWTRLEYYKEARLQLERIEARFSSATVRFTDNVHDLHECLLQMSEVTLVEDFEWFEGLHLNTYTKTSASVATLLWKLLEKQVVNVDDHFKEYEVKKRTEFMQWYSNRPSLDAFIGNGFAMLAAYCDVNPRAFERDHDHEEFTATTKSVQRNQPLDAFISSKNFRYMIDDLITIIRIALRSQIRVLDGEGH